LKWLIMRGREVYVAKVARLPFVSVNVGVLPTCKKEIAKRVMEIDIPRLEAESGLKIKAEHPLNQSSYSGVSAEKLALTALEELFLGLAIDPEWIDFFRFGSVISHKTDENAIHAFAKVVALRAGMKRANSFTLDKACSSGLMAIGLAYDAVANKGAEFAIGGGVEKMSDVPDRLVRFGLTNPFDGRLMAALADEVALGLGITREELRKELDDYAYESCRRAKEWQGIHRFIAPVKTADGQIIQFDEKIERRAVDRRVFAKAQRYPQFAEREDSPKCEVVTPLNSAQYADGGGFVLLTDKKGLKKLKVDPLARVVAFAEASGGTPKNFILKPEEAVGECLMMAGLEWKKLSHIEDNAAFAVGPVSFMKRRGIERGRMNRHGDAISHGHAIGGTGGALVVKAIDISLQDQDKYYAVTVCNAVDEAPAMLFENLRA